jgi:alpha-ketoglutarate-dependent taurine dioxygenase
MTVRTIEPVPRIAAQILLDKAELLSGRHASEIRHILDQRGVVFFRGVNFTDDEQLAFADTLGTIRLGAIRKEGDRGIMTITRNPDDNPRYAEYFHGTFHWHMDGSYEDVPPLASILSARVLSATGGQTEFANTYAAYEDLPADEKQALEGLQVIHSMETLLRLAFPEPTPEQVDGWRTSFIPKAHPLVWTHRSGRKSLVLGHSVTSVVGMAKAESDALLARLMDWATRPRFVYRHDWQVGDTLIWDNTGTLHRVEPYAADSGRTMHRVTLDGEEPLAQAA